MKIQSLREALDILCFEELSDKKTRKYDSKEIKINIYLSLKIKVIQNK